MAEFRFAGDPRRDAKNKQIDKADGVIAFGLSFSRKSYTEVSDEAVIAKLRANSHFEEREAGGE